MPRDLVGQSRSRLALHVAEHALLLLPSTRRVNSFFENVRNCLQ